MAVTSNPNTVGAVSEAWGSIQPASPQKTQQLLLLPFSDFLKMFAKCLNNLKNCLFSPEGVIKKRANKLKEEKAYMVRYRLKIVLRKFENPQDSIVKT